MARKKWSGRLDQKLVDLIKNDAEKSDRSEGYIVEAVLCEHYKKQLGKTWKPGGKCKK